MMVVVFLPILSSLLLLLLFLLPSTVTPLLLLSVPFLLVVRPDTFPIAPAAVAGATLINWGGAVVSFSVNL